MGFRFLIMMIIRFFRQARRELREAKSDLVRRNEETISLLQETAKRHTQTETSVDGGVSSLVVFFKSLIDDPTSNYFPAPYK